MHYKEGVARVITEILKNKLCICTAVKLSYLHNNADAMLFESNSIVIKGKNKNY